ncbi:MerR family transcriptional regulator [Anaerosinus massiliensis]|uniref:MerR family transcriptional regulator n=1 Tax=Massilibacillus massiliensis TaxID=1806837 RepID=UPI000DA63919|nr:MerR family transcriptional regulator [Massilibacillus massiliensis]
MVYLIGDISKATGFGIHTLRFYEKKNLISPKRDSRDRRIYSENDLFRLKIIKNFKIIGTSLEDIELYFHYFDNANEGKKERRIFLLTEKEKINLQIEHLRTVESFIDNILIKCDLVN